MWIWVVVGLIAVALSLIIANTMQTGYVAVLVPVAVAGALVVWGVRKLSATGRITR